MLVALVHLTAGVSEWHLKDPEFRVPFLQKRLDQFRRHDWGVVPPEDAIMNDEALASGEGRILASYPIPDAANMRTDAPDPTIWLHATRGEGLVILFPSEY